MNVMFKIGDEIVTPKLTGSILPLTFASFRAALTESMPIPRCAQHAAAVSAL